MKTIYARFRGILGHFNLDVEFSVPGRGITALFGPSGCGKTVVLRCMAGLTRMDDGDLRIDGQIWQNGRTFVPPHHRPIGYVFQEANLFPHLSVRANLTYGFKRSRQSGNKVDFDEVVALLGLTHLLDRSPQRLSGGERQRAAIGRALMSCPEVLLMDEPLSALDKFSKNEILPYLERLHDYLAVPVLYVSHDITEVERLADHMVLMGDGRVRAAGPLLELLTDPALPFARAPDAAMVIEGKVAAYDPNYSLSTLAVRGGTMLVPGNLGANGKPYRLRVSASDVGLCRVPAPEGLSFLNAHEAWIVAAEPVGSDQVTVFLRLGRGNDGARLMAKITRKSWESLRLKIGDSVIALVKSVALVDAV